MWQRRALIVTLALVGAQAFAPDPSPPFGDGGSVGPAAAGDRYAGRIEQKPGYGTYLCHAKRLWGGQEPSADATSIRRATLPSGPEQVPSAGPVPTAAEVAAWAAGKLGVPAGALRPEQLSPTVAANDWVDDKGVRHVRLEQWSQAWDAAVELGGVIVHLKGKDAVLITGGVIPSLGDGGGDGGDGEGDNGGSRGGNNGTAASSSGAVSAAAVGKRASGPVPRAEKFISEQEATGIALRAALAVVPDLPRGQAAKLRAAAARPTKTALVAAAAAPRTARIVHCSRGGACAPAYKQVVFLPPTATSSPKELHVYVSATDGKILLRQDRLRTGTGTGGGGSGGVVTVAGAGSGGRVRTHGRGANAPALHSSNDNADNTPDLGLHGHDHDHKTPPSPPGDDEEYGRRGSSKRGSGGSGSTREEVFMSLGHGNTLYSGEVPLNTAQGARRQGGGPYQLNDLVHGASTYDMLNREDGPGELLKDRDNQWGDGTVKDRATAAADAHYGASVTLAYFKDVHGRSGVDGRGSGIKSRVHLGKAYDNAYWYNMRMSYGDGSRDPRQLTTSCKGFPPMVTLDIAAHEIGHGVTEHTSGLIYERSYGGINEGLSDIFAQCVIDYAAKEQNYPRGPDFLVGSLLYPSGANCSRPFLRSMKDPTADNFRSSACWHRKFDVTFDETHNGVDMWCEVDVHWSSGVANRAFYLLAAGLDTPAQGKCAGNTTKTVTGAPMPAAIGVQPACALFYRATKAYLSRAADYYELRAATRAAAGDLWGANSTQAAAVEAAWDVVGVPRGPYPSPDAPECAAAFATKPNAC